MRSMSIERQIQTQQQVKQYIRGKLSDKEIDKLWVRFLTVPEWYDYFETELHLTAILNEQSEKDG